MSRDLEADTDYIYDDNYAKYLGHYRETMEEAAK